jgi:hypothetical protein
MAQINMIPNYDYDMKKVTNELSETTQIEIIGKMYHSRT